MRPSSDRKLTRFYIINPVGDRRLEQRFESREDVVVRFFPSGKMAAGVAHDIGQYGLRLDITQSIEQGAELEIAFPNAPDDVTCFGRVVWLHPLPEGKICETGVAVQVWHGIIEAGTPGWSTKAPNPKKTVATNPAENLQPRYNNLSEF